MVGQTLLHYEIVARIGAGGMGEVWRARDTRLDRDVAIKVLPQAPDADSTRKQRFLREARAASALIHPNIVTVHEINATGGIDFMVMEYIRGRPLSELLANPLPMATTLDYAIQICGALTAAHDAGVVHRDLKPGNIMVTPSGLVKVLDFGIAKRLTKEDGGDPALTVSRSLTQAGATLGTPAYMSPEQAVGDEVDARSDIFSFGVVLYQMLTGSLPFRGRTTLTLLRQIVHDEPPPLSTLEPRLPSSLSAIVDRCLAKEPDARYASASQVAHAIKAVLESSELPAPIPIDQGPTRTFDAMPVIAPDPRRIRWMPAAAVVVLLIAGTGWLARWAMRDTVGVVPAPRPDNAAATAPELYQRATDRLRAYYREGTVDQAIDDLKLALERRTPYPLAEARLSLAFWRKNFLSPDAVWRTQALATAQRAISGDAQLAVAHVAHGAALALTGELDKAAAAYEQALTLDPTNAELMWRMGDLAMARKDQSSAEQHYRRAIAVDAKDWEAHVKLGGWYYRQGRYLDALAAYESARALAPDHARIYSNLGATYHQLDRTDEAAAAFQRALEIVPDTLTYSNLGTLLYFQGRYPEAVSALERSVALGANQYLRWGNLADAQRMVPAQRTKAHDTYVRAVQLAREWLKANPNDGGAMSSLAVYLMRDGRTVEALAEFKRALSTTNPSPDVLFKCAIVAELAGRRAEALDLLQRSMAGGYQLREVAREPDLVNLRTDVRYHRLVARFQK